MLHRVLKIVLPAVSLFLILSFPGSATAVPPSIESESVSGISPTSATLEAMINPQSTERGAYYQFQLAEDPSEFAPEFTCPTEGFPAHSSLCLGITAQEGALPISMISAGASDQAVSLDLENIGVTLELGTTYYYRVIAARIVPTEDTIKWEEPTVFGAAQSFTASEATGAPIVEAESVSNLTSTDATLEATINPRGLETTYEFLLWESACGPECESITNIPLPSATLPASSVGKEVSLDLNSAGVTLTPGAEYGYSVAASNSEGVDEVEGEIFYAPAEGAPTIVSESAVTTETAQDGPDAILEAAIVPGDSEAGTYYQFQVAEDPGEFADEIECPPASGGPFIPCIGNESAAGLPIEWIAREAGETTVQMRLSEFFEVEPSTIYYFRVLAANAKPTEDTLEWEAPTMFGATKSIETQDQVLGPEPPAITNESATSVTPSDAMLNAEIDPFGEETTYRFQIDTSGHFKFDQEDSCVLHPPEAVCAQEFIAGEPLPTGLIEPPEQSLPAFEGPQKVSVDLNLIGAILQPSTTYYFRVVATHDGGEIIEGAPQTFTTPAAGGASGAAPGSGESPGPTPPPPGRACKKVQFKRHGICVKKHPPCRRKGHHAKRCRATGRSH